MSYFRSIDLRGHVPGMASIEFLRAEMPIEPGPLALIQYAVNGQEQRLGLRLDIDKGVFLDSPGDQEMDNAILSPAARLIVQYLRSYLLSQGIIAPARSR